MGEPVFVIHGVANHDREAFEATVDRLSVAAGSRWQLLPIFWGDLGADDRWVHLTVPARTEVADEVRGDSVEEALPDVLVADLLAGWPLSGVSAAEELRQSDSNLDAVLVGVRERLRDDEELRDSGSDGALVAEVSAAVAAEWSDLRWLPAVQQEELLREVGAAVADAAADAAAVSPPSEELRGLNVAAFVRRRLRDFDSVVGAAIEAAAGRLNTHMRSSAAPGVARFLGDVLVYQRHRAAIHARVRETVEKHGSGLGSRDRPVRVLGHSLGGVITLDLATGHNPLWVSSLLTFGSQFSFFHAVDPRGGLISPLTDGLPAILPPSVAAWTNLWEPLDLLAFCAAPVFRLHDGSTPRDVRVPHLASAGLWTHSAYWHLEALRVAMEATFGSPGDSLTELR
ncbi:hypothetical protein [Geodermatophilus poikilotrophus]|uniref:Alpha/beta hydrolase n=1 Tax=Geodermatophilus poikilotrophus TaxID=1333667 RepID=A0A1I0EQA0_9ACTN|nr:hypothetical protein [Geodermatophilus poikilotrophus]SET47219.1 hypothetical protein SAMN04488546_2505 [Geodermatophilus poikilotrophus]